MLTENGEALYQPIHEVVVLFVRCSTSAQLDSLDHTNLEDCQQ